MLPSIYINDQDVEALGLRLGTVSGPWDVPDVTDGTVVIPGRTGAAMAGSLPQLGPRTITLGGKIFKSDGARTNADLLAKVEAAKALLSVGLLEVRVVNQSSRVYFARLQSLAITMVGPAVAATGAEFTAKLVCNDPVGYDAAPSGIGFGASRVAIPLGSAPSTGTIRIMGPATNPVLSYRDICGTVLHAIGLTRSLLSTDYEEISLDNLSVTRVQSGVASNDIAAVSSGDIEAFVLSPEDGDLASGIWPTLECSGLGSGGGCEILYSRSYL